MKRYVVPLLLMAGVLFAGTAFKIKEVEPARVRPDNCFYGVVYDRFENPAPGITVTHIPPVGPQETFQTNHLGEYWFCRPFGGWTPGYYLITTSCCEKRIYRDGDGNIQVDFHIPCHCK